MRILVLSDTHGNMDYTFLNKIKKHGKFDMLVHCGDCCKDVKSILKETNIDEYINVNGNCDIHNEANDSEKIIVDGKNIIITHGHIFGVKKNLEELKNYAEGENADIVFFGHTHKSFSQYFNNILYFNPGSACLPTYGTYSYGIVTIENGQVFDEIIEW
ncbi:metallophosphoesterase [Sedimentibacter sp. zth1]|uniref:YfcE family phosphodiesterase n=1 Tax=Sedimentibacter sp. zth1 TaxID=2816908 RepID=UPI001A919F0F|nr:metallophosphoesterase [Sedimentibacter sp. zth1]QSX05071.1 metallophosphoesterase [Sedimentibacter sp. zth1]